MHSFKPMIEPFSAYKRRIPRRQESKEAWDLRVRHQMLEDVIPLISDPAARQAVMILLGIVQANQPKVLE